MNKIAVSVVFAAALATGMILATSTYTPSATAEYFYCSDRQTFSAFNNIVVPEGQTCILDQFNVVRGDIEVKQGATLVVCPDNDIAGSVRADGADTVKLSDILEPPCISPLSHGGSTADPMGTVSSINKAGTHGKITRTDDGSNDKYQFRIPQDLTAGYAPVVGDCVTFTVHTAQAKVARDVAKCGGGGPKALGLAIMGSVDIQNTNNFSLIGNPNGISLVRGDVSVANTLTVEVINVGGIGMTGPHGIGGNLQVSTSGSCYVSGNLVAGSTELSGCSNLAN